VAVSCLYFNCSPFSGGAEQSGHFRSERFYPDFIQSFVYRSCFRPFPFYRKPGKSNSDRCYRGWHNSDGFSDTVLHKNRLEVLLFISENSFYPSGSQKSSQTCFPYYHRNGCISDQYYCNDTYCKQGRRGNSKLSSVLKPA